MQYILLVYVQVGDPFACLSNNLRSQQLSFTAVMQMVSLQPPGEKGVQVELQLLQAVCSGDVILKCCQCDSLG
jgi:hypothetical protein